MVEQKFKSTDLCWPKVKRTISSLVPWNCETGMSPAALLLAPGYSLLIGTHELQAMHPTQPTMQVRTGGEGGVRVITCSSFFRQRTSARIIYFSLSSDATADRLSPKIIHLDSRHHQPQNGMQHNLGKGGRLELSINELPASGSAERRQKWRATAPPWENPPITILEKSLPLARSASRIVRTRSALALSPFGMDQTHGQIKKLIRRINRSRNRRDSSTVPRVA